MASIFTLVLSVAVLAVPALSLETWAWQSVGEKLNYPDDASPKPTVGISFSGGGSRSYIASMGYLGAFHKLDLIKNIDYIIGVSGGSWATAVYSYYQQDDVSDEEMLGPIKSPEEIAYKDLQEMDPRCVRGYTNVPTTSVKEYFRLKGESMIAADSNNINISTISTASTRKQDSTVYEGVNDMVFSETDGSDETKSVDFDLWTDFTYDAYLKPAGVKRGAFFTTDEATAEDIKSRNPELQDAVFQYLRGPSSSSSASSSSSLTSTSRVTSSEKGKIPAAGEGIDVRPQPIFGCTLVGPVDGLPYTPTNRNYSLLEITPLSAGVLYTRNVRFTPNSDSGNPAHQFYSQERERKREKEREGEGEETLVRIGGLVEPFAFGGAYAPFPEDGLYPNEGKALISVPSTIATKGKSGDAVLDLALSVGISSWAFGCGLAASLDKQAVGKINYWSPAGTFASSSTPPAIQEAKENPVPFVSESDEFVPSVPYAIADGGGLQVDNLISLVQRGVERVVLFCSSSVPLQPSQNWNPETDDLSEFSIDFDIPSFFGVIPDDIASGEIPSYDLNTSQIFHADDWVPLAKSLQNAQQKGTGIIATSHLTTVQNDFYAIPAGRKVSVVWVYLGRLSAWEAQLSWEMQELVIPAQNAEDLSHLKEDGPFESFPNYPTVIADINYERANLLADLTGWSILQNADLFREFLS